MDGVFLGNTVRLWLTAGAIVFVVLAGIALVRYGLRKRLARALLISAEIDDFVRDLLRRTKLLLLFFPALYAALRTLDLPVEARSAARVAAILGFLFQAGLWMVGVVDFWLARYRRLRLEKDPATTTTITAFGFVLKLALWSVVLLVALDNLGLDVTALVAGLGIGGVAVALATQNILGDLFASLSIVIDKPFVLGDVIHVGEYVGIVEHIGLKTTRVRSLSGEQLIFSNNDLIQSRIRNYKRMRERRVVFRFGVVYQTSAEKLERIPRMVQETIEKLHGTRFDRAHFQKFGESSLDFEVVYWVLDPDYNIYMDTQHGINLGLVRAFQNAGIEFAFPTRTVFMTGAPGQIESSDTGEPRSG